MRSICCDWYENGGSRSRTTNTSFGVQLSALAITDCWNDVVPILSNLIRFSRANPPRSSGQDKTRSSENRASDIRIVGPH